MERKLSERFKKVILWVTGYLSLVAFVISGGYFFFKDDDMDVLDSCKEVFIVVAIFAGIDIFNKFALSFVNFSGGSIAFNQYLLIVDVLKLVTFVIFFILDLLNINLFKKKVIKMDE